MSDAKRLAGGKVSEEDVLPVGEALPVGVALPLADSERDMVSCFLVKVGDRKILRPEVSLLLQSPPL